MPPRQSNPVRQWIAPALAAWVACASMGADQPITDPDIGAIMSGLRSANFLERERASNTLQRMVESERISEHEILELAARTDITAEQRVRLLDKAKVDYMRTPRAGMGISYHDTHGLGARLTQLVDTFPAKDILRVDDLIESIDGVNLKATDTRSRITVETRLRAAIISRDPGETVRVVYRRSPDSTPTGLNRPADENGRTVALTPLEIVTWPVHEADITLGNFGRLTGAQPITTIQLDAAWMLRVARAIPMDDPRWKSIPVNTVEILAEGRTEVPTATEDNQINGAGRALLHDRVFRNNANQINARTQQALNRRANLERFAARNASGANTPAGVVSENGAALNDTTDQVTLDALRELDARLVEIERRIAQGAAGDSLDDLLEEHRDLSEKLRAAADDITR